MSKAFTLRAVKAKANQVLHLSFADGAEFDVDLSQIIAKNPTIAALADPAIFKRAKVGEWKDTVTWGSDDLELAADNLRAHAVDQAGGARPRKVASLALIATPTGTALNRWTLRTRFDEARATAVKHAREGGNEQLAARIREFQFRDIRPKAASETDLDHASKLLGHTRQEITKKVYRRVGEIVKPTR